MAPLRFIPKSDLPTAAANDNANWMSLHENVEFLPADNNNDNNNKNNIDRRNKLDLARRQLFGNRGGSSNSLNDMYNAQPFVEGESDYDEYQQAWRYIGFMIDCNDYRVNMGDDDDDGGSGDGGTGEGCHRYVLWAAYLDLEYEGGGIGEYQFWNLDNQAWDTTPCNYGDNNGGNGRCAKMDCHLEDTHFSLLGFFKHKEPDDWMEQLFKHEGYCVWDDEAYTFMSDAREAWPEGCTDTGTEASDGSTIYYDIKPSSRGNIRFGLYTDTRCTEEYERRGVSDPISVENILGNILTESGSGDGGGSGDDNDGNYDFSSFTFDEAMSYWDSKFDTWKICQPCVAYDLNNVGYNTDDDASKGSSYNTYRYGYDDDYNYYANGGGDQYGDFSCYDDADYTNVNQCMKFVAKTDMNTATFRDLSLASTQGTLVDYVLPIEGYNNGSSKHKDSFASSTFATAVFFAISVSVLLGGIYSFRKVRDEVKDAPKWMKQPLVFV